MKDESIENQRKMAKGDKLSCGCTVIFPAWSREYAKKKVYKALAEALSKTSEEVAAIPEEMVLRSLGLETKELREFWSKFFIACEVDFKNAEDGTIEYLVEESRLPFIPPTIKKFIDEVAQLHRNPGFASCMAHML
jgi:hypothetical protein